MSGALQGLEAGLGVIEGFYGRPWPDADRLAMLGFLAASGYRYYVYAPKADATLRRLWRTRWEPDREQHLRALAGRADSHGLLWGFGLSPLGLVEDLGAEALRDFRAKLAYLAEFSPRLLCLQFDDMPRGVDDLAERQAALVEEVIASGCAPRLVVCPSYYTRDPVLERLFGPMPTRYWETLGERLPFEVGVFWTGQQVCSKSFDAADLDDIGARLRRPPVLWDNYPVNDGARLVGHLHVDAFRGREAALQGRSRAHFANPMNQCWLSMLPLATLPRLYRDGIAYDPEAAFRQAARGLAGESAAQLLEQDLELLQLRGLDKLGAAERQALCDRYAVIDAPWAAEILAWLRGEYAFDPACLTD